MFCRNAVSLFTRAKKDVLYDFLKREDIHWRKLNLHTAREVYRQHGLSHSRVRAFVLDDSIKTRRGKKMEDVSSHYDHTTNRHVMGQQVLTLGLASEEAFVPLDSQIYISSKKAQPLNRDHKDGRSMGAQRYREATTRTKPQMALAMMKRAKRCGVEADYLVADAWFGTKTMVRGADARREGAEIFAYQVRKRWRKVQGLPWRAVAVDFELDISEDKQPAQWKRVRLLFVRGVREPGEPEVGKKDWALFLSTDPEMAMSKMLEVYALRWGIEVYFKEAKQHLGFLVEQTRTFTSHTASIHLCAIRYLMLVHAKLSGDGARIGELRADIQDQLNLLSFAKRLWQVFRAIISDTLEDLGETLGCSAETLMKMFDEKVNQFMVQSLQLDAFTMRLEHE